MYRKIRISPGIILAAVLSQTHTLSAQKNLRLPNTADALSTQAQDAFARGDFIQAAEKWRQAATAFSSRGQKAAHIKTRAQLGLAYQALGQPEEAAATLESAVAIAQKSGDRAGWVMAATHLGNILTTMRQFALGEAQLQKALSLAEELQDKAAQALAWNNLGILYASQERDTQAAEAFAKSALLAAEIKNPSLNARAQLNSVLIALRARRFEGAANALAAIQAQTETLPPLHEKTQLLMGLAQAYLSLAGQSGTQDAGYDTSLTRRATELSQSAQGIAQKTGDQATQSLALGLLGQLADKAGDWDAALALTRRARFAAQGAQVSHLLFRWEWQIGRLLKQKGAVKEAISSYRRAVETLRTLCDCAGVAGLDPGFGDASTSSFRETIGPLYYELADLLLQNTSSLQGTEAIQINLVQARDTLELLKSAELQDYFQDDCVAAGRAKIRNLSSVLQGAAAVYYIPLPDRTEILLDSRAGLQRFTAPTTSAALTARIRRLRLQLERPTGDRYLTYAQELYDLLVRPIEGALRERQIKTLIFVPDGALRTIPMGVLHDGKQFLIEKWAVAVTPGLTLMDPQPLARQGNQVLAVGISESVQGYDALDKVPEELKNIQQNYGAKELLNRDFVRSSVQQQITEGDYSIVHIASHGEFSSNAERTYLLTYDGKLSLNDLESVIRPRQYQGTPVELLVLSACHTAAGDDRAALGLAGIAIKSGARSAIASLWSVSDEATASLMAQFYATLKQKNTVSKAAALQEAQVQLLKDERYNHPAYWAPYLIVGNWL